MTAVIPTWNRRELLASLLADLRAQNAPAERIIVVDNGSTDGSAEDAQAGGAEVIRWEENRGFAPAVNAGIRAASTQWVLILNNDIRLPPNWLQTVREAAERHPEADFLAPKLVEERNHRRIDGSFDAVARSGFAWRCGNGRADGPVWNEGRQIRFAPLTAVLVRRELFDRIGFLDERFESYYEDVEWFFRCAMQGISGWYEPAAVARHLGSATLGEWNKDTVFRLTRNQRYLVAIYFQELPRWPIVVGQLLWIMLAARHGCGSSAFRGWLAGRKLPPGPRPSGVRSETVENIVREGESTIRRLQEATGFDWYWKNYFRWTG
ncbi:MAG: glycosyltransferase family 2 protein [Bryobacteraceae bacterium]